MAARFFSHLLDLLFPPRCVFCGGLLRRGEDGICARCQTSLPWALEEGGEQTREFVSLGVSPLGYRDPVPASFHRYKFGGRTGYAKVYGRLMAQCVQDHLRGRYELITGVPLSDRRRKDRGYDQAFLLAQAAALELGDVAAEDSVEKAVNYLEVYGVVREQMAVTQRTIERVAMNIIEALYDRFPAIRHVKCTVAKLAPPLGGKLRSVRVIFEK